MRNIWYVFGFPIGKQISETIFLVDFLRQSKWQNPIFQKKKNSKTFPKGILTLKKPSLGYQRKNFEKKIGGNLVLPFWSIWKINQKNGLDYFFPYWEPKIFPKCSSCHFIPQTLLWIDFYQKIYLCIVPKANYWIKNVSNKNVVLINGIKIRQI